MSASEVVDYEGLRDRAAAALKASDYTQHQMAAELGVSRSGIAKAVTKTGARYQKLQIRLIETLTDQVVERVEHVEFHLTPRGEK